MPIAPNIQIRKLTPSEAKILDHIHMACQQQNWPWAHISHQPFHYSRWERDSGWVVGQGEVIVLARKESNKCIPPRDVHG